MERGRGEHEDDGACGQVTGTGHRYWACPRVQAGQEESDPEDPGLLMDQVLSQLPTGNSCLLAGNFNGHSVLWDTVQPSDSRGERIEEWIADNDLICSNTGTSTCTNRVTAECP